MSIKNIVSIVVLILVVTLTLVVVGVYLTQDFIYQLVQTEVTAVLEQERSDESEPTELSIADVVAEVDPAVVSIIVTKEVPVFERVVEEISPFGFFGGSFSVPRIRENGTEIREIGGGSGFIVSASGLVVTNRHVVNDLEAQYAVVLTDGTSYEVTVVARDPQLDIAVLQIQAPPSDLTYLEFGDSLALRLGEPVIAIGNALAEFRNSVSVGVVSGLSRSIVASDSMGQSEQLDQVIQTDAAINPGNSGGPLLNSTGEVIGVNVATSQGADNIGFALPAHVVARVVESVVEYGEIVRPFLGVRYVEIPSPLSELSDVQVDYGVLVIRGQSADEVAVLPGSPADQAGITEGTVILSIDGVELREQSLAAILRQKSIGDAVELEIIQAGERKTVAVTLERSV